jgi:carbamoyltransferase
MNILGISAFYHDSAAALYIDGKLVSAIEEERFSRLKHDNTFPFKAINYCLDSMGLTINDIDVIAYYEKPLRKFERLLETFVITYPFALRPFLQTIPDWLGQKINVEEILRKKVGFSKKIYYVPHHLSHASAAYYSSSFENSAILTVDGVGEYQTTALWKGQKEKITPLKSIDFPHSIGLLYSTFTAYLGFKINEDEYKIMGLSAYGSPKYVSDIYRLIDIKSDGSFALNMKYFSYRESFRMFSDAFIALFGSPRVPGAKVEKRHRDIAASIQVVVEELLFMMLNHLYALTKSRNLCIGGGVALNALANGKIYNRTPFRNVHILGAAGDSGAAIGAALYVQRKVGKEVSKSQITELYLGSSYSNESIESLLRCYPKLTYKKYDNESDLLRAVVSLLVKGKTVGWFWGRAEYGPRALGARSILSRPSPHTMKDVMNTIKKREEFRPFAGSVLQDHVHEYFYSPEKKHYSPFMNVCLIVRENKRKELAAIVHEDNTCRIQTVSAKNGRYYRLIKEFYRQTGIPCVLNTSFNVMGEPIVEHPRQAIEDFLHSYMDYLVLNDFVVYKSNR